MARFQFCLAAAYLALATSALPVPAPVDALNLASSEQPHLLDAFVNKFKRWLSSDLAVPVDTQSEPSYPSVVVAARSIGSTYSSRPLGAKVYDDGAIPSQFRPINPKLALARRDLLHNRGVMPPVSLTIPAFPEESGDFTAPIIKLVST